MNDDLQHLRALSIAHYVFAALTALFASFPIIHLVVGLALVGGSIASGDAEAAPLGAVGALFVVIGGLMAAVGWTFAVCVFMAGRNLAAHRRRTFCFVVASICCLLIPLGTVLGVFTLMVLSRPAVKDLFDGRGAFAHSPAQSSFGAPR